MVAGHTVTFSRKLNVGKTIQKTESCSLYCPLLDLLCNFMREQYERPIASQLFLFIQKKNSHKGYTQTEQYRQTCLSVFMLPSLPASITQSWSVICRYLNLLQTSHRSSLLAAGWCKKVCLKHRQGQ